MAGGRVPGQNRVVRPGFDWEAGRGTLRAGFLPLSEGERAGSGRGIARGTCQLDSVSDNCAQNEREKMMLTIEHIVVTLLLNLRAQPCRYRGVCGVVVGNAPITPL
jgi:hypothetical protein